MGLISRVSSRTYRNALMDEFKLKNSCPDSLSWNDDLNLLAIGGYNLDDAKNQTKSGEIYLLNPDLETQHYFDDVGAIFDVKWSGNNLHGCNTIGEIIKINSDFSVSKFPVTDQDTTLTHIDINDQNLAATSNKGDLF